MSEDIVYLDLSAATRTDRRRPRLVLPEREWSSVGEESGPGGADAVLLTEIVINSTLLRLVLVQVDAKGRDLQGAPDLGLLAETRIGGRHYRLFGQG